MSAGVNPIVNSICDLAFRLKQLNLLMLSSPLLNVFQNCCLIEITTKMKLVARTLPGDFFSPTTEFWHSPRTSKACGITSISHFRQVIAKPAPRRNYFQ